MSTLTTKVRNAYLLGMIGYLGLFLLLVIWIGWIQPPTALPRSLVLIVLGVPLLFPLRGQLHGRPYTFAWAHFMALFYFAVGIFYAAERSTLIFGLLIILFSILWFLGCIFYPRRQNQLIQRDATSNKGSKS
ncbi:MAG TPA: DUF2069 domain-containing protein [Gammaproteobacteria bacterium]|nr:DUF2069 domain-containing protein [Gammaproteobacteria bacterium]